jgi:hypothetical protein
MGGRSRANGMPNFLESDRCRSAKRSPDPLASLALRKNASGSLVISTSSASSAAIVAEFIEDDEVEAREIVGKSSRTTSAGLGLELVDETDSGKESPIRRGCGFAR